MTMHPHQFFVAQEGTEEVASFASPKNAARPKIKHGKRSASISRGSSRYSQAQLNAARSEASWTPGSTE